MHYNCRTVAYGVVEFLIAYVFLLVAFVVAFMIIFPKTEAFENPVSALVKVLNQFSCHTHSHLINSSLL